LARQTLNDNPITSQSNEENLIPLQRQWLETFVTTMNVFRLYDSEHPRAKEGLDTL